MTIVESHSTPRTGRAQRTGLVVVNGKARAGTAGLDAVIARLESADIACRVERPESAEAADRLVRGAGPEADLIVIGGGDGTISGLLAALLAVGRPVGLLPLGTANDLARTLDLPADPVEAAEIIAEGHCRSIDVGLVDERPFINVAHLGLGSEVAQAHEGPAKRWLGVLAYPFHWFRAYRDSRPIRVELVADGKAMALTSAQLAIGAGVHYGGGLTVADDAKPDDGVLHVYAVAPQPLWGWLRLLIPLKFGTLRRQPEVTTLTARSIELTASRPCLIDIDGEVEPFRSATFSVRPGALTMFTPRPTPG